MFVRLTTMCCVRKGRGMAKLVFGMNQSLDARAWNAQPLCYTAVVSDPGGERPC